MAKDVAEASTLCNPVIGSKRQKNIYPLLPVVLELWQASEYLERFGVVVEKLRELVSDHTELRSRARFIDYELHMCGTTEANAVPSIIIYSQQQDVKSLRTLFKERATTRIYCGKNSRFHFLVKEETPKRPPFNLVFFRTPGPPTTRMSGEEIAFGHVSSDSTMCGVLLRNESRFATLGLTLHTKSKSYGLTVAHLFVRNDTDIEAQIHLADDASPIPSVSSGHTSNDENRDSIITLSQLCIDDEDYYDFGDETLGSTTSTSNLETTEDTAERTTPTMEEHKWLNVGRRIDLPILSPTEADLDWALIELKSEYSDRPNLLYTTWNEGKSKQVVTLDKVANLPINHGVPVFVILGASGLKNGILLGRYSYLGAKAGQKSCRVWSVIMDGGGGE
jgi:hypothetical protein